MMKLMVASCLLAVVFPFLVVALITDLTWKRSAFLLAAIAMMAGFAIFGGLDALDAISGWFATGSHAGLVAIALAAVLLSAIVIRRGRFRRGTLSLSWGSGLGQKQFDRRCFAFLNWQGWHVKGHHTIGTATVALCEKDPMRRVFLFVADRMRFLDLQSAINRNRFQRFGPMVIVYYDKPDKDVQQAAEQQGWSAIHYQNLSDSTVWE